MSVLSAASQQELEDILLREQVVNQAELDALKKDAQTSKQSLVAHLLDSGKLTSERLTKILAKVSKVPYVNLETSVISPKMLSLLPQDLAERYMAVPLGEIQNRLAVAMLDPENVQAVDFISNKIGMPLKVFMASEEGIRHVLKQYAGNLKEGVQDVLAQTAAAAANQEQQEEHADIKEIVQDSPISRALNTILEYAAKNRASDVHVEPLEKSLKIRCRIDGILREIMQLPKSIEPALISRIKILSNLKIDEHRIPQDGQFAVKVAGREIDLRIAVSPVLWGEQVVIRLLDKSGVNFDLVEMGYVGRSLRTIQAGLKQPNGIIITSGPTGSGKSTTMYALIKAIKNDTINIVTLEDPIEYKIEGVNQIQVNPDVGLTFATGLRSILRQDPDVVMVGEIRDKETAALAVQAALTGHLVFSTLHTNSASGVLPRLLDMGVEPFLIASTVHTVIGQRCTITDFLDWCVNSIGSSMVMMWLARSWFILSITAASVVDLPEPVGPVIKTRPRGYSENLPTICGKLSCSMVLISLGIKRSAAAKLPRSWNALTRKRPRSPNAKLKSNSLSFSSIWRCSSSNIG